MTKMDKVTVDDIIGIVHTDEPTDSVEEVCKLRGRENRTKKRFKLKYINEQHISANLYDNETFIGSIGMGEELIVELLNNLSEENEQLKKEKEFWKSDACSLSSLNSILSNELSIAQEQGYEPSTPYKEYITSIKTEYDKFWENKIKTHNNRLKEL